MRPLLALALLASLLPAAVQADPPGPFDLAPAPAPALTATPVPLPGGEGGLGLDDLGFARGLGRVLVPAGGSGNLDLIDPASHQITPIAGFGKSAKGAAGHDAGTTSADEGRGLLFASDHGTKGIAVIDPKAGTIVARAPLGSDADYVRYVGPTGEVWATEPDAKGIEVFSLPASGTPIPKHAAFIEVPGGPEALVVDATRGRAYSNLWKTETVAIDLKSRAVVAHYPNSCTDSRGLALDEKRGFLFVGCREGKAVVLDLSHDGAVLDSLAAGSGVDIIAFDPGLSHLYFPGGRSATLAVLGVSAAGKLKLLGTVPTAPRAHCVIVDDHHQAWICDPGKGQVLVYKDELPAG